MRVFKLRVREIAEVVHYVEVPDDFTPYGAADLNDWANEIAAQDSEPDEILDVQVDKILEAEEVPVS